jgi:DNA polymerase I
MSETKRGDAGERVFLLDGSALAYRAHFAFARTPLSNDTGLNTGAIYGYVKTLQRILAAETPRMMAVIFDHPEPTFRHRLFDDYKATRQKMPVEMVEQLPYMKKVTEALGIPLLEIPGFEADDVIGTLALQGAAEGYVVNVVTGDKDFMQLVSPSILLYNIMKQDAAVLMIDAAGVLEKFGVAPDKVTDVLGLMGDSSDNVPGVAGIGEKTAIELVRTYGSLEAVLDRADEIKKPKLRASLLASREIALLSKKLVTIDCAVPLALHCRDLAIAPRHNAELAALYAELKFGSLLRELPVEKKEPAARRYRVVRTAAELDELAAALSRQKAFVVDTETTSLVRRAAKIVGIAMSWEEGEAHYVPLGARASLTQSAADLGLAEDEVWPRLRPILENPAILKIGQNIKYDLGVFANHGVHVQGVGFDTMIASYLLDSGTRQHDLDSLALKYFGHTKIKTTELIGTGKSQITMDLVPIDAVAEYAGEDADFTWRLYRRFERDIADRGLSQLLDAIETPLVGVLLRMEQHGMRVDQTVLRSLQSELASEIERVEGEIRALAAGHDFNIASPKQLATLLFEKLELHKQAGIKPPKTKTGYSTNQDVLEAMGELPLPRLILEHRSLTKLLSTYVSTLPALVDPDTGRIHTSFNQTVAATGRLSSSDPNLQNIPIRSTLGKRIREAFVASGADHALLSADYSQIELRIMAHVADDPTMIEAFRRRADIHRETASRIFGKAPEDVDAGLRSRAKAINFGILYGMGKQRLARETGMTQDDAQAFIDRYFDNFPAVRGYIERQKALARETGAVVTLLGRQRAIPDISSMNGALRSAAENMAVNTPIQGTAADFIKIAMIRIDEWIRREKLAGKMVLQVHDELLFDVPLSELELFRERVPELMSGVYELRVPLVVDLGTGPNWSAAH